MCGIICIYGTKPKIAKKKQGHLLKTAKIYTREKLLLFQYNKACKTYTRCTVQTLSIRDGPLKQIGELMFCTEKIWPHKIHHAPVFLEIVLQRVPC